MNKKNGNVNGKVKISSNGNGNGNLMDMVMIENIKPFENKFGRKVRIKCKNKKQKDFINMIDQYEITLCSGPAGCGKSHLSLAKALEYVQTPDNGYDKLYIITPTVELTKSGLGFLPGTFSDKISVYMNSVYKLIDKMCGKGSSDDMIKNNIVEVLGLGYIRGENFDNCVLIVEESQNISKREMLTILTRIGEKCKMIIAGDLMQIDHFRSVDESGLYHSINKLNNIDGIGVFEFTEEDVVRNSLITKILKNY